jgi:lipopolysaccharide biosynthesis protein
MKPLIVLHLYYIDLWNEYKNYFEKLDVDFDLIVTICGNSNNISQTIKNSYPDVKIIEVPNKGLDVGPFLLVMKYLKENNLEYSHIVKLHTKKSHYNSSGLGNSWRKALVECLIGSGEIFRTNLNLISTDSHVKMCGSQRWLLRAQRNSHAKVMDNLEIKINQSGFIGGTMFISDYNLLLNSFTIELLTDFYDKMPDGYVRDFSIAHDMERVFGFIVEDKGYQIRGV